mgnify:FL=1
MNEGLQDVVVQFSPESLSLLNIFLAIIMFGIALNMDASGFKEIVRNPKAVAVGVISQFLLLPFLTFLLVLILNPLPGLALGMFLVSACPGGNISNFFTLQSHGNTALSVSLTGVSTLLAPFLTPLNFGLWASLYEPTRPIIRMFEVSFWDLAETVLLILILPLIFGLIFKQKFPNITERIARPIKIISILILAGFIGVALLKNLDVFQGYFRFVLGLVFIHNLLALVLGFLLGILLLDLRDAKTLSIETGIQNSGLGLIIIFNFFDGSGPMALVAAWWGVWHIIAGFAASWLYRKLK